MILAIDPGLKGALVWMAEDDNLGHPIVDILDMPTIKIRDRDTVDAHTVLAAVQARTARLVVIERVETRPGNGAVAALKTGYGGGLLQGIMIGAGVPHIMVLAKTWKNKAGVPADKGECRAMAQRLWPNSAHLFKRIKDDGRADAALLARWAITSHL